MSSAHSGVEIELLFIGKDDTMPTGMAPFKIYFGKFWSFFLINFCEIGAQISPKYSMSRFFVAPAALDAPKYKYRVCQEFHGHFAYLRERLK